MSEAFRYTEDAWAWIWRQRPEPLLGYLDEAEARAQLEEAANRFLDVPWWRERRYEPEVRRAERAERALAKCRAELERALGPKAPEVEALRAMESRWRERRRAPFIFSVDVGRDDFLRATLSLWFDLGGEMVAGREGGPLERFLCAAAWPVLGRDGNSGSTLRRWARDALRERSSVKS